MFLSVALVGSHIPYSTRLRSKTSYCTQVRERLGPLLQMTAELRKEDLAKATQPGRSQAWSGSPHPVPGPTLGPNPRDVLNEWVSGRPQASSPPALTACSLRAPDFTLPFMAHGMAPEFWLAGLSRWRVILGYVDFLLSFAPGPHAAFTRPALSAGSAGREESRLTVPLGAGVETAGRLCRWASHAASLPAGFWGLLWGPGPLGPSSSLGRGPLGPVSFPWVRRSRRRLSPGPIPELVGQSLPKKH